MPRWLPDEPPSRDSEDSELFPVEDAILTAISSGLHRIAQTGFIFSSSGVSLDVIVPVVYRLENMGRDPSEEETKRWISLTESNISDFVIMKGLLSYQLLSPCLEKEQQGRI